MFAAGTVLAGKYRIDRVLGQGGMGTVVAATHLSLGQPFALKFLLAEYVNNRAIVERFVREARASAALRGEHVCRVSDVGALDDGTPYLVMELLEGRDLASLLAAEGPLPVAAASEYVLQACAGVAEAHALGIVHRDLKPANLFLAHRPDGTPLVKVLDFGIAKAQGDTSFHLTRTASVIGSPGYMSPEQLRSSREVDARSDIWSLGVILFELVTGKPPFSGESITELAIRVTMDPTPPLLAGMPPGFDEVVNRCLAKDPAHRYPDLASLAQALAAYAGPTGWPLAGAVSRVLAAGPRLSTSGMAPLTAPVTAPITAPHSAPPPVQPSQPLALPPPLAHSAPTTLGSATGSLESGAVARRRGGARWGIFAGMGIVAIGAAIALAATSGGSGGRAKPAAATVPAAAPPAAPAEPPAKAADPAPAPAPVSEPALDPATGSAAQPEPAPQQPPKPAAKPTKPTKPAKPAAKPSGEDFGESRF